MCEHLAGSSTVSPGSRVQSHCCLRFCQDCRCNYDFHPNDGVESRGRQEGARRDWPSDWTWPYFDPSGPRLSSLFRCGFARVIADCASSPLRWDMVSTSFFFACSLYTISGLSHCTTEDIKVRDYVIPKGATIEGNIWLVEQTYFVTLKLRRLYRAILYDPEHYPTPYTFDPSRFLGPSPAPDARKYIFGFGRWICPGLHVANNATWIMCAGLVSLFNIRSTLELRTRANGIGEETWKLFKPFDPMWATSPFV